MTEDQKKELDAAFKAAISLSVASSDDNHATCGSFHIAPFNTHWDKQTVDEVAYHVQLYVKTWIISPLQRAFGLSATDVEKKMLMYWHQEQAERIKRELQNKNP